jgi:hypothetical protein
MIKETPFYDKLIAEHDLGLYLTDQELGSIVEDLKNYETEAEDKHDEEIAELKGKIEYYENNEESNQLDFALSQYEEITIWEEFKEKTLELQRRSLNFQKPLGYNPLKKSEVWDPKKRTFVKRTKK